MDQVCTLKCSVVGSKPSTGPVRDREVRSISLKFARDLIFDPFLRFFPFDSLSAIPENPCTDIRGVRFTVCPVYRGTTGMYRFNVLFTLKLAYKLGIDCDKMSIFHLKHILNVSKWCLYVS